MKLLYFLIGLILDIRYFELGSIFSEVNWHNLKWYLIISFAGFSYLLITSIALIRWGRLMNWLPKDHFRSKVPQKVGLKAFLLGSILHYLIAFAIDLNAESLFLVWLHLLIWGSDEIMNRRTKSQTRAN